MGEQMIRKHLGLPPKGVQGSQITVDIDKATQKKGSCGCKFFIPAITVYTVSALLSPNGQELTAQKPVLICMECKEVLK